MERLGLSAEQLAADANVTPHVVAAWQRGTLKVSHDIAQQLRWRVAIIERQAVLAASGLAECSVAEALDQAAVGRKGEALVEAWDRLKEHGDSCPACRARAEYVELHGPPLPELPMPWWARLFIAINALIDRLPAGLRPPDGVHGKGRRMGLWMGFAFSALAIVIVLVTLARGGGASSSRAEGPMLLAVIIPAYFVGFYCAGAIYDALRPLGHRFIGYVLRWGLGGSVVYGTISFAMSLGDADRTSWSEQAGVALFLGGVWAIIGAGLWVKDRLTGKLAKRPMT